MRIKILPSGSFRHADPVRSIDHGASDARLQRRRATAVGAALLVVLASCRGDVSGSARTDVAADDAAIRARLVQWSRDWNARNLEAVCDLFAPDVVLTFPGGPDRNHATMCDGFKAIFARTDRTLRYDEPAIEEVLVSGDLAVVRLEWTSRLSGTGLPGELPERERGIDVFQRQPDGRWRIHVSHAYPRDGH